MVERAVQLIDGVRAKCVAHLGPVERHPHRPVGDVPVIRDIGQILEAVDGLPLRRVKRIVSQGL